MVNKLNLNHPIVEQSFAIIDVEMGELKDKMSPSEYAIIRRVIHTTADFEYVNLLQFSDRAIESGINALGQNIPIVTDVTMVRQGIATLVSKTWNNPIIAAIENTPTASPGKTRTETAMVKCFQEYPQAIYLIGNAPTALIALCKEIDNASIKPSLVIGAPVGFVKVIESKQILANTKVPQIIVNGRKGGSPVAAAILNALLVLAWEN
jgi:precorrin-8X/cobalt-precorrin-8 methylmutase